MGFEPTTSYFINEHSTICPNWPWLVSVDQWCAALGTFYCHKGVAAFVSFSNNINSSHFLSMMLNYIASGANIIIIAFLYAFTFFGTNLSICYWNLDNILGHNFSKIAQLKACNSFYLSIPYLLIWNITRLTYTLEWQFFVNRRL